MAKTCTKCDQPRMVSPKTGKEMTMCEEHQRAYWRKHKTTDKPSYRAARHNSKAPGTNKKSPRQSKPVSHQSKSTSAVELVLIDAGSMEIWRVTAVREHVARNVDDLNEHVLPILKRGGARIVNIVDREV